VKSKVYCTVQSPRPNASPVSPIVPPLKQIVAELAFRSTLVPFSQAFWDLQLVDGHELPPGPCFIYGNHSGNYDPFIYNAFTRLGQATAGVMTMEYLESGPIASLFRAVGIEGTRKRMPEPHLIRSIYKMLDAGRRIVIFPEGGRRWDGRPAPWIESTAKLFMRAGAPVYPVEIIGSYVAWPRWASWPRPAHIKVKVHDAVDLSGPLTLDEGLARLKAPIASDETMVPQAVRPGWAFRPADGIDKLLYRDPVTGEFGGVRVKGGRFVTMTGYPEPLRVLPDSRLHVAPGEPPLSTADLYDRIRSLPLPEQASGTVLSSSASTWIIRLPGQAAGRDAESSLEPSGKTRPATHALSLYRDRIEWGDTTIPLEKVLYMGIERNDRLWLVSDGVQRYAHFSQGSVLAWYDTISRLAPHINA